MSHNLRSLSARHGLQNNLFDKIRSKESDEEEISSEFLIGTSSVLGVRSFYDFIKPESKEKKVCVCQGTACMTSGKQAEVKQKLLNHFSEREIGHVSCVGHCHSHSAFLYDGQTYSWDDECEFSSMTQRKSNKSYDVFALSTPSILTSQVDDVSDHYALLQDITPTSIVEEVKQSQLRGRGGAGFPFGLKLEACASHVSQRGEKYIVCNADEGDPGAYSDMYLLEQNPHLVLFGMIAAGKAVQANQGVLYIRCEYPDSIASVHQAISELRALKIIGEDFEMKVIEGAGAYVCGEETALLNSIEGLRPEVRVRPPFPAESGLFGEPTVLSNVETFANLHAILKMGGEAFAQIGTEKSKGTKLISLDGLFVHPGIYEVEMGYAFSDLVHRAGGWKKKVKAVQVGGPLGGVFPVDKIQELSLDFESFSEAGYLLGHAGVVSIPEDFPMIDFTALCISLKVLG